MYKVLSIVPGTLKGVMTVAMMTMITVMIMPKAMMQRQDHDETMMC